MDECLQDPVEQENTLLRNKLDAFLQQVRENESKKLLLDHFELNLIAASTLDEIHRLLSNDFCKGYELSDAFFALIDNDDELNLSQRFSYLDLFDSLSYKRLQKLFDKHLLGSEAERWFSELFPEKTLPKGSLAIFPLQKSGYVFGVLVLISEDHQRYTEDQGTLFLNKLAAIVSVTLLNAMNQLRLKMLSYEDELTQIYNHRYFNHRLYEEGQRSLRLASPLSLLVLDIDNFSMVNRAYGHEIGDTVLNQIARILKNALRTSDILARYSGEQFIVLLTETDLEEAEQIAERIRFDIAGAIFESMDAHLPITASLGLASVDESYLLRNKHQMHLSDTLLAIAEECMQLSKQSGKNCLHSQAMIERMTVHEV